LIEAGLIEAGLIVAEGDRVLALPIDAYAARITAICGAAPSDGRADSTQRVSCLQPLSTSR
jgi:hypothetical protein